MTKNVTKVKVRTATPDDTPAIVRIHCSNVEKWYHYSVEGRGEPADYRDLTPEERKMHGGPWMDIALLSKAWDHMRELGIISLVAELEGIPVGHLDILYSEEPDLGTFQYLDVLMVHKGYRRRGVATALIHETERQAGKKGVRTLYVRPAEYEGPSGLFYRNLGFKRHLEIRELQMDCSPKTELPQEITVTSVPRSEVAPLKTHIMVCGRANISLKMWDYAVDPAIPFPCNSLMLAIKTWKDTCYLSIEQDFNAREKGFLCLWVPISHKLATEHLSATINTLAVALRLRKLSTIAFERNIGYLTRLGFQKHHRSKESWMRKVLK